jgi:hypothetical protein
MPKKIASKIFTKNKNNFFGTCQFPLLKLKMWFFVQECATELPFLSSVKIIFHKFRFFSQILSPIRLGAILCAHALLCAPTVSKFLQTWFLVWLFYQNVQIYAYFGVMCRCIPGGIQLILTSNPWVWKVKSDRKEGGILGPKNLKFKSLHLHNINNL